MSIPASNIVKINPGVVGGGGNALALNGVILTTDTAVPIGTVQPFTSAAAVGAFFGASSDEKALADVYFRGYTNCTKTPGRLFFSQYAAAAVPAYLRGGSMAAVSLAQLKAMTGILTVTIDGTAHTSSAIVLTSATSFSNAATTIAAAFTSLGGTVAYDSVRAAFKFISSTTGAASTITVATGTLAASLKLTAATGAVLSQGADAMTPGGAMDGITDKTQNWAVFMLAFDAAVEVKKSFAAWVSLQNNRWCFAAWDDNAPSDDPDDARTLAQRLLDSSASGTAIVYRDKLHAAFVLAVAASTDFERENGRLTFAFKMQPGLIPSATEKTLADELTAAGLNFIGEYATANDGFTFFGPGQITGQYRFIDEYLNQVWLNAALQLALLNLFVGMPSIPYNAQGYGLIDAACMDPIIAALKFGAIRTGVPLDESQKAQVNNAAGTRIDDVLSTRGWYLQILPATAQVRAARGTPPMSFWYMDGGSVQMIEMASIVVQ